MGASSRTRGRLSAPLKESGCYREHYQGKSFFQKTGLKQRQDSQSSTSVLKISGVTWALLAQEYDLLVLEDLDVQGLIQSGTKKRRRLRLHDSSFSELRAVLEWEFVKRGKLVLPLPAYNTSRECFLCGGINQSLTLEDRVFLCPRCGFSLDRDLNASLVLLKRVGWVPPFQCACG